MSDEILITGAGGFVGRHLDAALRLRGIKTRLWTHQQGDIARANLDFPNVRQVVHLAAKTFVPESWNAPLQFYEVNVLGTANVLEFCRRQKARMVFISSYVYGRPQFLPITESHPLEAFNPYGHTKLMSEDLVTSYGRFFGVQQVILRPFNIYGPGQEPHFLIPEIISQALDPNKHAIQLMDLRPKRDYLHVNDLVSLIEKVLDDSNASGVFNAGSGHSVSVEELGNLVNQILGQAKPLTSTNTPRPNEVLDLYADISRAAELLQWKPSMPLEEGLAGIIADFTKTKSF